ncbi:MAG: tetratricopeptide repeat protein [Desulfobacteraceae bacterium]|nr:tetratricopeptide repeat protein [Desulfobacteraceae bacterium]
MTSEAREQAIELMDQQKYAEALTLFQDLICHNPGDWALYYMAGQCCRFLNDLTGAIEYLRKSIEINPKEPSVLLALGIALQLNKQYEVAVDVLKLAIEVDSDFELGYNSLALTQRKMGQLEKALDNYDAGAKALARRIVKNMKNSRANKILKHKDTSHNLWVEYAAYGMLYLCCLTDSIDYNGWPTGEQAVEEEKTERHAGLYWVDRQSVDGKTVRLFLPNYFNTFREILRSNRTYSSLIGSRGTVLEMLGRHSDAEKHFEEASEFLPIA